MIKLAISGAAGRMGKALIRLAAETERLEITAAIEHTASPAIGQDAGLHAGVAALNLAIAAKLEPQIFDVLVEFTTPTASLEHLQQCRDAGKAIMIGTTGMDAKQQQQVIAAGNEIPLVLAANTSVGINLCVALLETAARVIGAVTDIEIIESHHKHKVDAPSGTALLLGEAVAQPLGKTLAVAGVFSREGITGARADGTIGFSSIRGGDIAGEHTVLFIGESERLEITHRVTDRKIFAAGALRAAEWLARQPAGCFDMQDVLGLR